MVWLILRYHAMSHCQSLRPCLDHFFVRMKFATLFIESWAKTVLVLAIRHFQRSQRGSPGYFEKYGSIEAIAERNATDICSARSGQWKHVKTLVSLNESGWVWILGELSSGFSWIVTAECQFWLQRTGSSGSHRLNSFDCNGFPTSCSLGSGARMLWLWLILGRRGETWRDQLWEAHDLKHDLKRWVDHWTMARIESSKRWDGEKIRREYPEPWHLIQSRFWFLWGKSRTFRSPLGK